MKEDFLNYVWQHQYFNKANLCTLEGEVLQILKTGMLNGNAGPDFLGASIKIGDVIWNGSVEMHVNASDWHRHQHQTDTRYDQVILHVVWEANRVINRTDGSAVATLALVNLVNPDLLASYEALQKETLFFPCQPYLKQVPDLYKLLMLDQVLLERLELKQTEIQMLLSVNKGDWEETTYQILLSNFGFKINQDPFQRLSKALPFSVLRKQTKLFQVEALLFGQAGFLSQLAPEDAYLISLKQEYTYLRQKYKLPPGLKATDWNFLRLRPANFPTVRLAQAASFLVNKEKLFTAFFSLTTAKDYLNYFKRDVSEYWQNHYMPGRTAKSQIKGFGLDSRQLLVINTVIPLLVAFARLQDNQQVLDKALNLLAQLKPEHNNITQPYEESGIKNKSAADSQGILQLHKYYCLPRQCLSCSIGHSILKYNLPVHGTV